jgi:Uma2 family endonuclease
LTPDFLLIGPERLNRLHEYYLDGPADVVIEILLPGHEAQDAVDKRHIYAAGDVPEYWIVNPVSQTIDFLRLIDGDYQAQPPDANGRYRSASIPGLACVSARLWAYLSNPKDRRSSLWSGAFEIDPSAHAGKPRARSSDMDAYGWDRPPFAPQLSLCPTPITFEQYIAWCPEAKFECIDGQPLIGGWLGTRNVLGLLLMTFGLEAAMTVLHPSTWVAGMLAEEEARRHDTGRRDVWWARAREAAELLRAQAGVQRVAVIGDLVRAAPLHYWSELTLVIWQLPKPNHDVLHALYDRINEPRIDVVEAERATRAQQQAIANEAVDL